MVIPRLVRQALGGEPLTIFGDGTQSRCFCHVTDIVRALLALLDHPDAVGEVFNVGATDEITINDLAAGIGIEDMARRLPDTTKLHNSPDGCRS